MTLDRSMYEALAGLLKASLLQRVGGAMLSDLKTAEKVAVEMLQRHHREYVEGGEPNIPETTLQPVMAPALPVLPVIVRRPEQPAPKPATRPDVRKGRPRLGQAERAKRNAAIKDQYRNRSLAGAKRSAICRELAALHGISAVAVNHIVKGYGAYK